MNNSQLKDALQMLGEDGNFSPSPTYCCEVLRAAECAETERIRRCLHANLDFDGLAREEIKLLCDRAPQPPPEDYWTNALIRAHELGLLFKELDTLDRRIRLPKQRSCTSLKHGK